ncbi:kinase-like domain-containing protein [Crepidotus variabilis]|uniref:non-specific serine/threonine protein kinase n=1 Tax=Crepidotus variabilis TaxID=179855 RepID=A0A9P6E5M9_9AGAR|nr:kinase-like domain-containing protein [Crepidotus variabilis]
MSTASIPPTDGRKRRDLSSTIGGLTYNEKTWRTEYTWLLEQGYQLRERYAPEWKPSWVNGRKEKPYYEAADGLALTYGQVIDAIRVSDGRNVVLKRLSPALSPFEEDITRFLSSDELSQDRQNHCVPLLDVLHPPDEPTEILLVIPALRNFDSPRFDTIGEGVQCCRQLFEGIHFMHRHRVAHRDINFNNFMMDAPDMFPQGYHFNRINKLPDLRGDAPHFTRTQRPPRYYLIDFGLSRRYQEGEQALEPVVHGGDRSVPEFRANPQGLHDPFKTDIYYAGNLLRETITEGHKVLTWIAGYIGFEFLNPLIADMVQDDPNKRPTIDEVLKRFEDLAQSLSAYQLRSRPVSRRESVFKVVPNTIGHWKRKIWFTVSRTSAVPQSR